MARATGDTPWRACHHQAPPAASSDNIPASNEVRNHGRCHKDRVGEVDADRAQSTVMLSWCGCWRDATAASKDWQGDPAVRVSFRTAAISCSLKVSKRKPERHSRNQP